MALEPGQRHSRQGTSRSQRLRGRDRRAECCWSSGACCAGFASASFDQIWYAEVSQSMSSAGTVPSDWQHAAPGGLTKGGFQTVRSAARRDQQLGVPTVRPRLGLRLWYVQCAAWLVVCPGVKASAQWVSVAQHDNLLMLQRKTWQRGRRLFILRFSRTGRLPEVRSCS